MVVIPGPVEFVMGSPLTESGRDGDETQHKVRIGRTFVLAAKPVTLGEYRKFEPGYGMVGIERRDVERWARSADCPVVKTNWAQAVQYCNWLSKQEGLPESEWCYEPVLDAKAWPLLAVSAVSTVCLLPSPGGQGPFLALAGMDLGRVDAQFAGGMRLARNYLQRQGYRLPTEAEMEYATRAGAVTARYYGETEELLPKYAWYNKNGQEKTWRVGSLKPNDLGLFDAHGNVWTWCQQEMKFYPEGNKATDDTEDDVVVQSTDSLMLRGGSFDYQASRIRSAQRNPNRLVHRYGDFGFRLARTLRLGSFTALSRTADGGHASTGSSSR